VCLGDGMKQYLFGIDDSGYYTAFLTNGVEEVKGDLVDALCLFCFPQPSSQGIVDPYQYCLDLIEGRNFIIDEDLSIVTIQICRNNAVRIIPSRDPEYPAANKSQVKSTLEKNGYRCS